MKLPALPIRKLLFSRNAFLLYALVGLGILFQLLTLDSASPFLSGRSISTVLRQVSVVGVIVCGMTLVIVLTHIDLSVGSAVAFLGALAAWMMAPAGESQGHSVSGLGWPPWLVLILMMFLGLLLWAGKGWLQVKTGMPAFIITLGGFMAYRGLALNIAVREIALPPDNLLSRLGTQTLPMSLGWVVVLLLLLGGLTRTAMLLRQGRSAGWSAGLPALLTAAVIAYLQLPHPNVLPHARGIAVLSSIWGLTLLLTYYLSEHTVFGRQLYATGGNREAAYLSGISVNRITIAGFSLLGFYTAVAAMMELGQQGTAVSGAGNLLELDVIAACVLGGVSLRGGRGSVLGATLGALIMQVLGSGLYQCGVQTGTQMLIKAVVLIVFAALNHGLRRD